MQNPTIKFCLFADAWSPWMVVIFNWHSTSLETRMSLKNRCPAERMFSKSVLKNFKGFGSGFPSFMQNFIADILLDFVTHCKENEIWSQKSSNIKTVCVYSMVSHGGLIPSACRSVTLASTLIFHPGSYRNFPICPHIQCLPVYFRVRVRVTLRLTISQSVWLGIEPNLGQLTKSLLSPWNFI
jgi:hypothetical protein